MGKVVSGIFGGGGGGSTTVQQSSANETHVTTEVGIQNVLDLGELGTVFAEINEKIAQTIQATSDRSAEVLEGIKNIFAVQTEQGQKQTLLSAVKLQVEDDRNKLLARGLDMVKFAGIAVALFFVGRKLL